MKKLFLTAAFTLVGVIAVSAQTEQKKTTENPNNSPSTTQTEKPSSKPSPTSDPNSPQRNTTTMPADTAAEKKPTTETTQPADVTKEEKKSKKKK
ncbi:hypothetical protein [Chryseobacterium sp. Mn2064]|uniref:hypothetical protein n=1 Tax=Chryseobacterium sp. Mn2064 TaxID=3395263 RepID=UPI003BC36D06